MAADPAVPHLFEALEAPLAPLERLPRALWLGGLTHAHGRLVPRLQALEVWRGALLQGRLPAAADWREANLSPSACWPPPVLWPLLHASFDRLQLAAYCRDHPDLVDTVLQSLLFHLDLTVDYRDRGAGTDEAGQIALEAFTADWAARCGELDELVAVFGDLGDLLKNTRWDVLRGLLRSSEWQEVVRIRQLIERLPELARIIRSLGRVRRTDEDGPGREPQPVVEPAVAPCAAGPGMRVPELPGETRGVRRSGRIARMLPAETMLFAHPRLRLVWHARHAERTLLTYEDDDRLREDRRRPAPVPRPGPRPAPRLELGPVLICVDTSGSMRGGAEAVAKAVVLEAVRCAHAQGRACHVFAFGGPDEVLEMTLALDAGGVAALARFLGQGFGGGTDVCGPIERAIARLEQRDWRRADLLIASDGEFGATPALAGRLRALCRAQEVRVQGVLIGDRETIGLLELADDIYWVRDWRRYGDAAEQAGRHGEGVAAGGAPVHSPNLTASYFPGALRSPQNRARTVGGEAAAAALRAGARAPMAALPAAPPPGRVAADEARHPAAPPDGS